MADKKQNAVFKKVMYRVRPYWAGLVASLLLGIPAKHAAPYELESLPMDKVHYEKF